MRIVTKLAGHHMYVLDAVLSAVVLVQIINVIIATKKRVIIASMAGNVVGVLRFHDIVYVKFVFCNCMEIGHEPIIIGTRF